MKGLTGKKVKKVALPVLATLGFKFLGFLPIFAAALALAAVKAIIFGKMALIMSAILAYNKYFANGGSVFDIFNHAQPATYYADSASSSWNAASAQAVNYRNQYYDNSNAASMAYAGQQPAQQLAQPTEATKIAQ